MIGSVDIYFHRSPFVVFFLSVASSFKKTDNAHAYFWGGGDGSESKLLTLTPYSLSAVSHHFMHLKL